MGDIPKTIIRRAVCPDCGAEHGQRCRHDRTCQRCGHRCDHTTGGCIWRGCRCRIPLYKAEPKHRPRVDLRYELAEVLAGTRPYEEKPDAC